MSDTSIVESSQKWVDGELSLQRFGEKEMPGIRASELYKWLEVEDKDFAQWTRRKIKTLQLLENKDFVCNVKIDVANKKRRGGHNAVDYVLSPRAALQMVTMSAETPKGLATLRVLTDLALKVNQPDYQFVKAINKRYEEIHGESATPERRRPWSERLTDSFVKHFAFVNNADKGCGPGWWTVLTATNTILMVMEDSLLSHCLPCSRRDLPDGSIGQKWSLYRREVLGYTPPKKFAPLYLPDQKQEVWVQAYPPEESGVFHAWLFNIYLPENLPMYFGNKFKKICGVLPPHSAADNTCRTLTNKPACLPDSSRRAIDSSPHRMIKAAERPSLN